MLLSGVTAPCHPQPYLLIVTGYAAAARARPHLETKSYSDAAGAREVVATIMHGCCRVCSNHGDFQAGGSLSITIQVERGVIRIALVLQLLFPSRFLNG